MSVLLRSIDTICPLLLCGDAEYAVGVNQKLHFDTRQTSRHRRNVFEVELRKTAAILYEFAFALKNVNLDVRLPIDKGCEHLRSRCGNSRVAGDDLRHHSTHRLDA